MFSVIIPLYNKASHIEKCLNSVLAQTFAGYEIIVVNDGSTDKGEEVVRKVMAGHGFVVQGSEVQGSRFKVQSSGFSEEPETRNPKPETRNPKPETRNPFNFKNFINFTNSSKPETLSTLQTLKTLKTLQTLQTHPNPKPETLLTLLSQRNSGVSTARNNGVKLAQYDYIAFLDADDWWEPDFLAEIAELIKSFPEAGIYGSSYNIIKNNIKKKAPIGLPAGFETGIIDYCSTYAGTLCMPLTSSSVAINKMAFNTLNGFNSNLKLGEDFDLWIRLALKYPVAFTNKSLSNYNQDVELASRAVGRLHPPENHMLWNLEYLNEEEKQNRDIKLLLDKLRLYGLWQYHISKKHHSAAVQELKKVAVTNYSRKERLLYSLPFWAARIYWKFRLAGSALKRRFGRWIERRKEKGERRKEKGEAGG